MTSLDQNDADSAVFHDCMEGLPDESGNNSVSMTDRMPNAVPPTAEDDVEAFPIINDGSTSPIAQPSLVGEVGSSIPQAIFNFTNSIVGAGCIGLGGAIALSGGFVSIALVIFFAVLTKLSLDMLVRLSLEHLRVTSTTTTTTTPQSIQNMEKLSYEDLAHLGMGWAGRVVVMLCKFSYSFGCLVAYEIVIKDNFGPALKSLIYGSTSNDAHHHHQGDDVSSRLNDFFFDLLSENAWFTWIISAATILPLCMLRDMTPLAFTSLVSVACMIVIVAIVMHIYFDCPEVRQSGGTFYENWLEIRPGLLNNLGTFVFSFVSQHTVHLVFASLKPRLQTVKNWKIVSFYSLLVSATVSLLVGVFVYMTFWQNTKSDIFEIYPESWLTNSAKLLLCITMIGTFPLPFFTCRELLIVTVIHPLCGIDLTTGEPTPHASYNDWDENDLQQPLLDDALSADTSGVNNTSNAAISDVSSVATDLSRRILHTATPKNWLLPDDDRQLQWPGHVGITFKLWFVATGFAVASPNLGDILALVGCASGTLIAFIIPSLLSFRLEGYSNLAMLIFVVGGIVGTFGTYYSVKQLVVDLGGR
ncbi:transmembrane amino acid transporter [Nitzschia inconspicua]|uniref:Transmembrane amino acid transporter n=1 Tax=Nitzschia inconspicua TaxID=303405 RepID=A0A9K3KPQ7_9STRA|nr:transmembrane amino acid transporter [Nitzschia inconspicua]